MTDEKKYSEAEVQGLIANVITALSAQFVMRNEVIELAKEAIPSALRNLDRGSASAGDTLKLNPAGVAEWGQGGGLSAKGDKVLYKGVFLREYDENGTIVAAGSEINPGDYATQALYEAALVAISHTLKATWDWLRGAVDVNYGV